MRNGQAAAHNLYSCLSNHDMQSSCFSCCCDKIPWQKHLQEGRVSLSILAGKTQCRSAYHNRLRVRKQKEMDAGAHITSSYLFSPRYQVTAKCLLYLVFVFILHQLNLETASKTHKNIQTHHICVSHQVDIRGFITAYITMALLIMLYQSSSVWQTHK